jgi:hypothetical protein
MLMIAGLIFLPACRRNPRNPTIRYQREIAEATPPPPQETYMSDRYPWEGRKRNLDDLPERIVLYEKKMKRELKWWDRLFRRDCCPPPLPDRCRYHCHHPCNCPR